MRFKSSFNALIMAYYAPYNPLYNLMNTCNHTVNKL